MEKTSTKETAKVNPPLISGKYLYAFSIVSFILIRGEQSCVLHSGIANDVKTITSHIEKAFKALELKYRNAISLVNFQAIEKDKKPIMINLNSFKNSIENIDKVLIEEIEKIIEN